MNPRAVLCPPTLNQRHNEGSPELPCPPFLSRSLVRPRQLGRQQQHREKQHLALKLAHVSQRNQQDQKIKAAMHQRRPKRHHRQYVHREDDLFDKAGVTTHSPRRA